ncbi:phospholipase A [Alteromonas lipolytica]|uniref:phospholipase A n=1 Tax=Alteromonas lipolytica TaxID=1856405 RepID=UPI000AB68897|nr:phospholipase A [Alteromonas lipolytica]GGF75143.1 phospholipase [Alteromonas lipolytica]
MTLQLKINRLLFSGILLATSSTCTLANDNPSASETATKQQGSGLVARPSLFTKRFEADKELADNTFAITQFRRNYFLPYTYVDNPNALGNAALTEDNIDNKEAKFQISIKLPLYTRNESAEGVYFGFTLTSFWQLYNTEVSKPFRETNYEPEIFYQWNTDIKLLGIDFNALQLGFNHMSNGQSEERSRSWNRIMLTSLFSDADDIYYLRTWYRIPEDAKTSPTDTAGDDNPRITHYFGRVELGYGTRVNDFGIFARLRNNLEFDDNRGSIELSLSYPVSPRYEVVLQYFSGYGDSLIDYNRRQNRIGLGFQLAAF